MANEATVHSRVAVFAKAPVPYTVKTRLISVLGADGAVARHRALVERAIECAIAADIGTV